MTDRPELIDAAVERLVSAYRDAGLPPITPAPDGVRDTLSTIAREIAPLRLPAQVERFWQLVDPHSVTVAPYPHLTSAEFALESWADHRDSFPGMTPRLLFPIAYESHGYLLTELDDGHGTPGAVLEWEYAGCPFRVGFASLAGYLDLLATMVELGEFERHEHDDHVWYSLDRDGEWRDAQTVRLAGVQPLPRLGSARELDEDVRRWPAHWLASNGLTEEARTPRGASTTIADLLDTVARTGIPTSGTIQATVTQLVGSSDGSGVTVDDGTGTLHVWCPPAVCTYGPVIRTAFEFDVVVRPGPSGDDDWESSRAEVQRRALAGDLEGAGEVAKELARKALGPAAKAEATAIRPLD